MLLKGLACAISELSRPHTESPSVKDNLQTVNYQHCMHVTPCSVFWQFYSCGAFENYQAIHFYYVTFISAAAAFYVNLFYYQR